MCNTMQYYISCSFHFNLPDCRNTFGQNITTYFIPYLIISRSSHSLVFWFLVDSYQKTQITAAEFSFCNVTSTKIRQDTDCLGKSTNLTADIWYQSTKNQKRKIWDERNIRQIVSIQEFHCQSVQAYLKLEPAKPETAL